MRQREVLHEEVYRGRWARPFTAVLLAIGAFVVWDTVSRGEGRTVRVVVGAVTFVLALVYALAFRPAVALGAERIRILGVLRDAAIPWARVAAVRTRWSLLVETDDGRTFPSWAISSGRPSDAAPAGGMSGRAPTATAPRLRYSDAVKQAVVRRWETWRGSGRPDTAASVEVTWAWPSIGVLAAGTVAVLAGLLW